MKYKGKHHIRYLFYAPGNNVTQPRFLKALCGGRYVRSAFRGLNPKERLSPQSTPKGTGRQWTSGTYSERANVKHSVQSRVPSTGIYGDRAGHRKLHLNASCLSARSSKRPCREMRTKVTSLSAFGIDQLYSESQRCLPAPAAVSVGNRHAGKSAESLKPLSRAM